MTNHAAPTGGRRKIWATDVARQAYSAQRRKMARDASRRERDALIAARQDLRDAKTQEATRESNRRKNMVVNGLAPQLTAVMNSWGIDLPVRMSGSNNPGGWTDFLSVNVTYDERLDSWENKKKELYELEPLMRVLTIMTRAIFYHEVGHNLFTVPAQALVELAYAEGWKPSGTPYSSKMQNTGIDPTGDHRWCEITWKHDDDGKLVYPMQVSTIVIQPMFVTAWNILEDQRMETALVEESPIIAGYLTALVTRLIMTGRGSESSWSLVAGRRYLPDDVRRASRKLWESEVVQNPFGETVPSAGEIYRLVTAYCRATTAPDMVRAVVAFMEATENVRTQGTVDSHQRMARGYARQPSKEEASQRIQRAADAQPSKEADEEAESSKTSSKAKDEPKEGGSKGGDQSDKDTTPSPGAGEGESEPQDNDFSEEDQRALAEAHQKALDELLQSEQVNDDVGAINEAYNTDPGYLPTYEFLEHATNEKYIDQAHKLAMDIEDAFHVATASSAPHWSTQERRGHLDVMRYAARQPGEMNIFRDFVGDGEPGHDIAVTMLLDVSTSMSNSEEALGAAAWAVKTACDRLDIECDVNVFNNSGWNVWGVHDRDMPVPRLKSTGGTTPSEAIRQTLSIEKDQKHHLVIIMTDGEWFDTKDGVVARYSKANQTSVGFWYGGYGAGLNRTEGEPLPKLAQRMGTNEAFRIGDLYTIPRMIEHMLTDLVS